MNYIAADNERNAKSAFLDGNTLQFINRIYIYGVEDRTDAPGSQSLGEIVRRISLARIELTHLANLLAQRHFRHQLGNALLNRWCIAQGFRTSSTHRFCDH